MPQSFAQITKAFFDRDKVSELIDKKTKKVLSKFGAMVRRTDQFSQRSRKGSAKPGNPPHAHGEKQLRKFTFFSYDESEKAVYIGPVKLRTKNGIGVPRLMEVGGDVQATIRNKHVTKVYRGHPHTKPAFMKHVGTVAEMYRGKV